MIIKLEDLSENDWILGNIKHAGYYRVNYDQQNWKLLQDQLKADHLQIDATSRATLLDDAFNLGKAELLDQTVYLDMASYLSKEEDPLPFTAAIDGLEFIHNMLASSGGDYPTFKAFSVSILYKVYLFQVPYFIFYIHTGVLQWLGEKCI